jgi:octaprenyl-diphosphate synthase
MAQILGDLFFVKSFELCGQFSPEIIQRTAKSCSEIAEGEIIQLNNMNNVMISKETILRIAELKTASLFSGAMFCGACLANANNGDKTHLENFGHNLGLAFQIMDDILDYTGTAEQLGKNSQQDIIDGKITLPLYFAFEGLSENERQSVLEQLKSLSPAERYKELTKLFEASSALDKTRAEFDHFYDLAKQNLKNFEYNGYIEKLDSLINRLASRKY